MSETHRDKNGVLRDQVLEVRPLSLREANAFVDVNHRHHPPVRGCKFCIAVVDGNDQTRGVLVAGRPVSRHLDDGRTLEITRCCTDGVRNGCSALYAAASRIARAMGYARLLTYTLRSESGASLRGAGWVCVGERGGGSWHRRRRPRRNRHPTETKLLWIDRRLSVNNSLPMT